MRVTDITKVHASACKNEEEHATSHASQQAKEDSTMSNKQKTDYEETIKTLFSHLKELRYRLARPGDCFIGARISEVAYCLAQDPESREQLSETVGLFQKAFSLLEKDGRESHRTYDREEGYVPSPAILDVMCLDLISK